MLSIRIAFFGFFLIAAVFFAGAVSADQDAIAAKTKLNDDYQLSGPFTHENLAVYLIHGKEKVTGKQVLSLADALEKGLVTIHETGDVNRLTAQNHSTDHYVFIQSGDLVKGGRQDRTLGQDILLPPKSEKIALDSFCVEQGRWSPRGEEKATTFSASNKQLSSKALKLAAKKFKSQTRLWQAVAEEQERLSRKVGQSVHNPDSATSLQLSLENEKLEGKSRQYRQAILPIGRQAKDAVGFAYAIDGQFTTADIYGSTALFQELWSKLLEAATCEAIALSNPRQASAPPDISLIKINILEALNSPKTQAPSDKYTKRRSSESISSHAFETKDEEDQMLHLNVIKK